MDSALLEQHQRDIAVPFPELTYAPSKKSVPWPPKVRTAGPIADGGDEASHADVPAAKKGWSRHLNSFQWSIISYLRFPSTLARKLIFYRLANIVTIATTVDNQHNAAGIVCIFLHA